MKKLIQIALGAAILAAAAPAVAAPAAGTEESSVVVSYAGLDLSRPSDAARLDRRIRAAVRQVCGEIPNRDLGLVASVQACQTEATQRASAGKALAMRGGGDGRVLTLHAN